MTRQQTVFGVLSHQLTWSQMCFSSTAEVWEAVAALVLQWPQFKLSRASIPRGESGGMCDLEKFTGLMSHGVTLTVILMMCNMQYLSVKVQLWPGAVNIQRPSAFGVTAHTESNWIAIVYKLYIAVHKTPYLCAAHNHIGLQCLCLSQTFT